MSCDYSVTNRTNTLNNNFPTASLSSGIEKTTELKTQLINDLVRQNYSSSLDIDANDPAWEGDIKIALKNLSFDQIKLLHQILIPIFSNQLIYNQDRFDIVLYFTSLPFESWEKFGKQIQFLSKNARGAEIRHFQEILVKIKDVGFRDLLLRTANQLFDWDTTNFEKGVILDKLCKKDATELNNINNLSVEQKILYAKDLMKCIQKY